MEEFAVRTFAMWEAEEAAREANVQRLRESSHLTLEDLCDVKFGNYSDLVIRNSRVPVNTHNLEVLLRASPEKRSRSHFLAVLQSFEVETLELFLRYEKDIAAHVESFKRRVMMAIHREQHDVLEALLDVAGPHFEVKDFTFYVSSTLEARDVSSLDIVLRYIEAHGKTFKIANGSISLPLIKLPVEFFDRLYLRGFDPFSASYEGTFANRVINRGHHSLIVRLFEMNVIQEQDYRKDKERERGVSQRYHFRQLLLANQIINTRKEEKDFLLRRYLCAQKHQLPMVRALSREAEIFNREKHNTIAVATVDYLNLLRPEMNPAVDVRAIARAEGRCTCRWHLKMHRHASLLP